MNIVERSKEVFRSEIAEIERVASRLDDEIRQAVELIDAKTATNKVVITGIGKSGIIGKKIAASMASTGTPAIFINAAEALHGDLGMATRGDVVIAISNSGESDEILNVVRNLKKMGCPIVAMTGDLNSTLAKMSDIRLDIGVQHEACKIGLAPTTSTTATLVMGDALIVCLMEKRNFKPENFALYHPGGALGRRMLTQVKDCMTHTVPTVAETASFKDVLTEVTLNHLGITLVQNAENQAVGIITDGDIRRAAQRFDNFQTLAAKDFMSRNFKKIGANSLVNDALELMDRYKITTLAVVENDCENAAIIGILHIHHIYGFAKK